MSFFLVLFFLSVCIWCLTVESCLLVTVLHTDWCGRRFAEFKTATKCSATQKLGPSCMCQYYGCHICERWTRTCYTVTDFCHHWLFSTPDVLVWLSHAISWACAECGLICCVFASSSANWLWCSNWHWERQLDNSVIICWLSDWRASHLWMWAWLQSSRCHPAGVSAAGILVWLSAEMPRKRYFRIFFAHLLQYCLNGKSCHQT